MANPATIAIRDANNNRVNYEPNLDPAKGAKQDELITLLTAPSTFNAGQKAIAVTGTAVRLSSTSVPLVNGVTLQASPDNAAPIVIGLSTVANTTDGTGNGKVLQPGQAWAFAVSDLNILYANGTAGDWLDWSAN